MIVVAVSEEDMLGSESVDAQASIEEEVELWDDKGGVPGGAGSARQDVLMVGPREAPLEDL